jgi:hypothetical protein
MGVALQVVKQWLQRATWLVGDDDDDKDKDANSDDNESTGVVVVGTKNDKRGGQLHSSGGVLGSTTTASSINGLRKTLGWDDCDDKDDNDGKCSSDNGESRDDGADIFEK